MKFEIKAKLNDLRAIHPDEAFTSIKDVETEFRLICKEYFDMEVLELEVKAIKE